MSNGDSAQGTRRTKVAIVGFASHWVKTPFADSDFEIWCLNEFYDVAAEQLKQPLADQRVRWFEIHQRLEAYEGNPFVHSRNGPNHAERLAGLNCPVYMGQHWDDIPQSIAYPREEITARYGRYFTNSISWMIALALDMGFQEIHVYGVDMAQDGEYHHQRPSCEYFVGLARGMGKVFFMPPESDLCQTAFLYGFEAEQAAGFRLKMKSRLSELEGRLNHNRQQIAQAEVASNQLLGAIEDCKYVITRF